MMDWLQWRGIYITGICLFWLGYVLFQVRNNKDQLKLWGFSKYNFKSSLLFLSPFIAVSILGCIGYAGLKNNLNISWHILPILLLYPLWGIIQQFLMLGIISQNLSAILNLKLNRFVVIVIVSALFSMIHYPSTILMIFTFFMEVLFISVYFKWRNLWTIGIAHGWIATFLLFYVLDRNLWVELFSMG